MTNPFHSEQLLKSISNYPVAKGDLPGHEFHGNQWTTHTGAIEKEHANLKEAIALTRTEMAKSDPDYHGSVTDDDHMWDTATGMANAHRDLAVYHRKEMQSARRAGDTSKEEAHSTAWRRNNVAFRAAQKYINQTGYDGDYLKDNPSAKEKIRLSEQLLDKSQSALDASRAANGVSKSVVAKGDLPGHEFHGNQYTDSVSAEHSAHAKTHEARSRELLRATRAAGWTHTRIMEDPAIKAHLDARIAHETAANIASSAEKGVATAEDAEAASIKAYKASNEAWAFDPDTPRPREYYLADEGMGGTRP